MSEGFREAMEKMREEDWAFFFYQQMGFTITEDEETNESLKKAMEEIFSRVLDEFDKAEQQWQKEQEKKNEKSRFKTCFGDFNQAKEDSDNRACLDCIHVLCLSETRLRNEQEAVKNCHRFVEKLERQREEQKKQLQALYKKGSLKIICPNPLISVCPCKEAKNCEMWQIVELNK